MAEGSSRNQNPSTAESQSADDDGDTLRVNKPSPVTQQSEISFVMDRERDSCPAAELATTLSSAAVNENEDEIDGDLKNSTKKKKKKKKKKRKPNSSDATSTTNFQGEDPATSNSSVPQLPTAEVDEASASTVSLPFKEGENEDAREGILPSKRKTKKKKRKKTPEVADSDVPVCGGNNYGSPSNDIVPSQAPSSERTVQEACGIKSDVTNDRKEQESNPDETIPELSSQYHELLTAASAQNKISCHDSSIIGEFNVQRDSSAKSKKKKKRQKKQEIELNTDLPGNENGAAITPGRTETEQGNLLMVAPEHERTHVQSSCAADVVQEKSQGRNETEANTQLLSDKEVNEVSVPAGYTLEPNEPDQESSSATQSLREERNILCIFKLVYGVGLRALRKLFIEINPTWSNQPSDAAAFDKWKMKLSKDEEASFNNGDINEWDFSLMTTALLYSKSCALEMNKRPGCAHALQELKICRNMLLGHPSTERMSDVDFDTLWPQLSNHFETLGAEPDEIAEIRLQSDEDLYSGEYYKQLFLSEQAKNVCCSERKRLEEMDCKLDILIANQSSDTTVKAPISPKDLGCANWDEWLNFCVVVGDFESHENQYILVTDSLPSEDLECFSNFRGVSWKMILDFDPMSEEKGFYREFTSKEGQSNLVSMITPAELRKSSMGTLLRQLDPQKTQWLFVNGRYSDTEGSAQSFPDWEATSVKHISRLFGCCSDPDKFDKQKPIVCVILPFRKGSLPYLEVTLCRLIENFDEFKLRFVSFKHEHSNLISRKFEVRQFDVSPKLVSLGLSQMFNASATQEYRMPSSHAGVSAKLSQNEFLYLKEHLQILYDGCEDLPEFSTDPAEAENFFEEHRKSFISGNQISLVSLFDNHDARREIELHIRSHVHRLLDQGLSRSLIVEIRHSPGTGGSTIARRVMWDLHKTYPCALLEISSSRHYFDEDNTLSDKFANRITALEEICHTSPVILIDGKQSGLIEGLSNKLVRMLGNKGKRALLLRCQHGSKNTKRVTQESHVHHVFDVNVKLEDSIADLNEFQSKYKEYIAESLGENQRPNLCRVFHFPLLAMMEEFRPKLKKIIEDTLDEMGGIQQEMAMVVAFLQKYANHATPAFLLYEAFKGYIRVTGDKPTTYEDIKQLFTEHLLNLMVPTDPLRRRGRSSVLRETPPESYTLQHPLVADLVLKKVFHVQECDLFGVVNKFLQFPIYQHECFLPLFEELFLHNKYGLKLKFSILFEDLKLIDSEHAARIFREAAMKTNDAAIFANAARFLAKKEPPSFSEAKDLIHRAFEANSSKVRLRSLYHTKGVVLVHEMKSEIHSGKVKDLQRLEDLASEVLKAYHEARNFPPTYPHPLIGEVEVWLACIDWIMKNRCSRDSDKTLRFLTNRSPPFFRTCVSDSFTLLDIVDGICQSVPNLTDPEETQRLSNNARLSLLKTFKQGLSVTGRRRGADDLIQACKALCSAPNFPRSSQVELKKLQAHFILSASDPVDILNHEHLVYLLKLLEELVLVEHEYRLAYHLMKVCVLVTGPRCYSLEQGLAVSEKWRDVSSNDCLPYFYQMTIYFLKILDGNSLEFAPKYTKALRMCQEKSQNHFRSTQSTLFVGKGGQGMSRLITRNTLFRGETDYATDDSDKVSKFWQVDSRKKLLECKGRIRVSEQSFFRGKIHPYIELVQGNLQLYVGKNADIGKVERDFSPGALVYFVVSFNLHGPVANGITFSPQEPSNG